MFCRWRVSLQLSPKIFHFKYTYPAVEIMITLESVVFFVLKRCIFVLTNFEVIQISSLLDEIFKIAYQAIWSVKKKYNDKIDEFELIIQAIERRISKANNR